MKISTRIRRGYSLIEMVISIAILAIIMTTVMETLISTKGVLGASDTRYGLELEGQKVLNQIAGDLNDAIWYLPGDLNKADLLVEAQGTRGGGEIVIDRSLRYYPFVMMQTDKAMGSQFEQFKCPDDEKVTRASFDKLHLMPPNEHKFASKEMVFVKMRRPKERFGMALTDAGDYPYRVGGIEGGVDIGLASSLNSSDAVPFDKFYYGKIVPEMVIKLSPDGKSLEGVELSKERNADNDLREFFYGVRNYNGHHELRRYVAEREEGASGVMDGSGRVIRTAKDGVLVGKPMIVSQFVDRIAFDTCRTDFSLNPTQIRVQVWLSRRSEGSTISHKASMTIAMRSNVDPEYAQLIDAWLGTPGNFPVNP